MLLSRRAHVFLWNSELAYSSNNVDDDDDDDDELSISALLGDL